jgi:small-conductance mechanosensitive channel
MMACRAGKMKEYGFNDEVLPQQIFPALASFWGERQMNSLLIAMAADSLCMRRHEVLIAALSSVTALAKAVKPSALFSPLLLKTALIGLLMFSGMAGNAIAQANPAGGTGQAAQSEAMEQAEVTLDGRTLFHVRGVKSYPAEVRARDIAARIHAIAADSSISVDSLRVVETEGKSDILAAERLIVSVHDFDAEMEGVPRHVLAEVHRKQIASAFAAYRSERSPDVLLTHTVHAIGATLAVAVLFFALRLGRRWLDAAATRRMAARIEVLERESKHFIRTDQLRSALHGAFQALRILLTLVVIYVYLNYVFGLFPWTRPVARGMFDLVMDPLRVMGASLIRDIPDLAFLVILIVVTRYILKLVRLFFEGIDQGRIKVASMDSEVAWPTYRIVRLLIIVFALVVAYPYIPGSESDAFKGISLFLGLVFSLGSTSVIGNLIAGYAMIYRRAFKIGDRIKVGEISGDVLERKLLVTRLRTIKNEEVVIPNSEILNSNIINFSTLAREQGLILHTTVCIGYGTPWRQVEAMLRMAAERTPGLLAEPKPFVLQKALGDFGVTYEINVYCDHPQAMARIYTDLHRNILDVFNEYGVQIMTPAYEGDTDQPKVVPRENWFAAPAEPPAEGWGS